MIREESILSAKTKATGTFVVLALAVGLAYSQGWGLGRPAREDTEEQVVLEVTFTPNRMDGIHIIATAEGAPLFDDIRHESPWVHSEWVPRGARVSLRAWQESYGELRCAIYSRGKEVARMATSHTPGNVACVYRST